MENTFGGFQSDFSDLENQYTLGKQNVQKRSQGEKWADLGLDVLSGAGSGAGTGALFGGVGAPVGAAFGGLVGLGKGIAEWLSEDKKQFDLSKSAEKYNLALTDMMDSKFRARRMANDMVSQQAMSKIQESNLNEYLGDINNPY